MEKLSKLQRRTSYVYSWRLDVCTGSESPRTSSNKREKKFQYLWGMTILSIASTFLFRKAYLSIRPSVILTVGPSVWKFSGSLGLLGHYGQFWQFLSFRTHLSYELLPHELLPHLRNFLNLSKIAGVFGRFLKPAIVSIGLLGLS